MYNKYLSIYFSYVMWKWSWIYCMPSDNNNSNNSQYLIWGRILKTFRKSKFRKNLFLRIIWLISEQQYNGLILQWHMHSAFCLRLSFRYTRKHFVSICSGFEEVLHGFKLCCAILRMEKCIFICNCNEALNYFFIHNFRPIIFK